MKVLNVALDTPLRQLFDYGLPPSIEAVPPGCRVRVPFGRRRLVGIVVGTADRTDVPADKLRAAFEVLDAAPLLDATLLGLLGRAATYYHHPLGSAYAAALPRLLREGATAAAQVEWWSLTPAGEAALAAGDVRRAPRQLAVLQRLAGSAATSGELGAALAGDWRTPARALATAAS